MRYVALFLTVLMAQTAAFAGEPSTYSPDYCNFQVTFPDKPAVIRRCEDDEKKRCYDLVSYTQTYEMNAAVNFRVICNPIQKGVREKYTEDVAKAAIRAMAEKNDLKGYRTSFRKETDYNEAGLVGEGTSGAQPKIYIAQLWVGDTSVMSVEGELVGEAFEASDKLFAEVMKSVSLKQEPKDDKTKPSDKSKDADKDGKEQEGKTDE